MTSNDDIIPWDLPRDVISKALSFLPPKSIASSSRVAKLWKDAVQSKPSLREKLNLEKAWRFGVVEPSISDPIFDDHVLSTCTRNKDKIALACWNAVFVLDLKTGNKLLDLRNSERCPRVLSFVDTILVAGYLNGDLCGWDIVTGVQTFRIMIFDAVFTVFFERQQSSICGAGNFMVVGRWNGAIGVWEKQSWKKYGDLEGHKLRISSLTSVRHGELLVSVSKGMIGIWDIAQLTCLRAFDNSIHGSVITSCVDESESVIVWGTSDRVIYMQSLENGAILADFPENKETVWFFGIKNSRMLSHTVNGEIKVWDLNERKCIRNLQGKGGALLIGVWIDDEKIVAISELSQIIIWDFTKVCS